MVSDFIEVEVAYATPEKQMILRVSVDAQQTLQSIIETSGILQHFPEIDLNTAHIGIFSRSKQLTDTAKAGERIEIYRPLTINPKEARRRKAKKQR